MAFFRVGSTDGEQVVVRMAPRGRAAGTSFSGALRQAMPVEVAVMTCAFSAHFPAAIAPGDLLQFRTALRALHRGHRRTAAFCTDAQQLALHLGADAHGSDVVLDGSVWARPGEGRKAGFTLTLAASSLAFTLRQIDDIVAALPLHRTLQALAA